MGVVWLVVPAPLSGLVEGEEAFDDERDEASGAAHDELLELISTSAGATIQMTPRSCDALTRVVEEKLRNTLPPLRRHSSLRPPAPTVMLLTPPVSPLPSAPSPLLAAAEADILFSASAVGSDRCARSVSQVDEPSPGSSPSSTRDSLAALKNEAEDEAEEVDDAV